jgi:hypothetical protein
VQQDIAAAAAAAAAVICVTALRTKMPSRITNTVLRWQGASLRQDSQRQQHEFK